MDRTPWLRERRMKTFEDVPERLETPQRCRGWRWRHRHEEEGLGVCSTARVPVDRIAGRPEMYRTHSMGWTVKPFHEHLQARDDVPSSDTWTKTALHQDGSRHAWLSGQAPCDLPPARAPFGLPGCRRGHGVDLPGCSRATVCTARGSHSFQAPEAGGLAPLAACSPKARGAPSAPSAQCRIAWSRNAPWPTSPPSRPPTASSGTTKPSFRSPARTQGQGLRVAGPTRQDRRDPLLPRRSAITTSRRRFGSTNVPMAPAPSSTAHAPAPATGATQS